MADINVEIFTPDSTRAASTSYAMNQGVPMKAKLTAAAGWSQESKFVKFCKKENEFNFGQKLIKAYFEKKWIYFSISLLQISINVMFTSFSIFEHYFVKTENYCHTPRC